MVNQPNLCVVNQPNLCVWLEGERRKGGEPTPFGTIILDHSTNNGRIFGYHSSFIHNNKYAFLKNNIIICGTNCWMPHFRWRVRKLSLTGLSWGLWGDKMLHLQWIVRKPKHSLSSVLCLTQKVVLGPWQVTVRGIVFIIFGIILLLFSKHYAFI